MIVSDARKRRQRVGPGKARAESPPTRGLRSDGKAFMYAAQAVNLAMTFVTFALMARSFRSVAAMGEFGLARSITVAFTYAADLGIRLVVIHLVGMRPDETRSIYATARSLRIVTTLLTLPVVAGTIACGGWQEFWPSITVAALAAVTHYGSDVAAAVLLARKRTDLAAAALVADRVLMLVCVAAAMTVQPTVVSAFLGMLAANVLRGFLSQVMARRTVLESIRPGWSPALARDLLRRGWPVGVSLVVFSIYGRATVVAMDKWSGDATELGLLSAAVTLVTLLNFLPTTVGLTELPTLSAANGAAREEARSLHRRCFRRLLFLGVVAAAGLCLLPKLALSLLFGREYAPAAACLQVLALSLPFGFLNHLYRFLLIPMGAQAWEMVATLGGFTLQVALAALWIPQHQAIGAASAFLAAEVVVFAAKFAVVQWKFATRAAVPAA